ncbi:MAG: Uma2 family endonuclease [Polyangiales bacterium]
MSNPPDPRFPNLRADVVAGYLDAPETMVVEVIDGELSLMPRPRRRHARAAGKLGARLDGPFDVGEGGPGGWIFLPEPELHLGPRPDIVVPDLAGWRRERVPEDFLADDAPAHIDLAPDWVCEVLSESTEAKDRGKKRRIYRRERVGHYWLVDPREKRLEVERLVDGKWAEVDDYEGDVVIRAEPFDAVDFDLSALWRA